MTKLKTNSITKVADDQDDQSLKVNNYISQIKQGNYRDLIDTIRSVNQLPKEALQMAQNAAATRAMVSEIWLSETGLPAQMSNYDILSGQIASIEKEIQDLLRIKKDELAHLNTNSIIDKKRDQLSKLIKTQSELAKEMKYVEAKSSIQIQNNINNIKTGETDLFRVARQKMKDDMESKPDDILVSLVDRD